MPLRSIPAVEVATQGGKTPGPIWNRACCHSITKLCTIRYISAEVFVALCLTTVLAQPVTSQ